MWLWSLSLLLMQFCTDNLISSHFRKSKSIFFSFCDWSGLQIKDHFIQLCKNVLKWLWHSFTGEVHSSWQHGSFLHRVESCVHHDTVRHLIRLEARVDLQQIGCGHLLHNHSWKYGRVIQLSGERTDMNITSAMAPSIYRNRRNH